MIELETMLMQFCLETSGRREGDRYPVGKGGELPVAPAWAPGWELSVEGAALAQGMAKPLTCAWARLQISSTDRRIILRQRADPAWSPVTVLHGASMAEIPLRAMALAGVLDRATMVQMLIICWQPSAVPRHWNGIDFCLDCDAHRKAPDGESGALVLGAWPVWLRWLP